MYNLLNTINATLCEAQHVLTAHTSANMARAAAATNSSASQPYMLKANGSPVSEADLAVSASIKASLAPMLSEAQHDWLDEEAFDALRTAAAAKPINWKAERILWVSDPLAGTMAYGNQLPFYAIALGALRAGGGCGRPVAGGLAFPALAEIYLSDGADIFCNGQKILPPVASPPHECVYHHGAKLLQQHYDVPQAFKVVTQLPVINMGWVWVALRRVSAGFFHPYIWDLVAAWPLLKASNIGLYDVVTGAQLETISAKWLTADLRFQNLLLACDPALRDHMLQRLQSCARPDSGKTMPRHADSE